MEAQPSFVGDVVLITGGLGGIGQGVAQRFLDHGAHVVLADLDPDRSAAGVKKLGNKASFVQLDVASEDNWISALEQIEASLGPISVLANVAGFLAPNFGFEDIPFPIWRKHFDVNVDGTYLGCKHGLKSMRKRGGGSIVNISTGLINRLRLSSSAYIVAKAGIVAITRLAALHAAKDNVRVNVLLPGAIDTPMLYSNMLPGEDPEPILELLRSRHPVGRIGTPADIAHTIMFLCDRESSFITGAVLAVDGGQTLVS